MLVRYWMTESPIVAVEDTNLHEALHLMVKHDIRRLPVVSDGGKLTGMITLSDLYPYIHPVRIKENLSQEEIQNLKKHAVREAMSSSPVSCNPNTSLEDAGSLMRDRKIGALPVLKDDRLVGIITDCDVLEALTDIARAGDDNVRICLSVSEGDRHSIIYRLVDLCKGYRLNLQTVLLHPLKGSKRYLVMLRVGGPKTEEFVKALWNFNYQVLIVSDGKNK